MKRIIGVQFKRADKIYEYDPKDIEIKINDSVIVEADKGLAIGKVMNEYMIEDDKLPTNLKSVVRHASQEDINKNEMNREKERDAFNICKEKISQRELPMKLISVEYLFDGSKIIFYFKAEGRIDFRDLVKDLANAFHTRIEMRQIGVRDETKILSGVGPCGRELCCSTFLIDFEPVSVKMAKKQNLALNPSKISGICGRLMCCITFEQDFYIEPKTNCIESENHNNLDHFNSENEKRKPICNNCEVKSESTCPHGITQNLNSKDFKEDLKQLRKKKKHRRRRFRKIPDSLPPDGSASSSNYPH